MVIVYRLPVQDFDFQCAGPSLNNENVSDSHRDGVNNRKACSNSRR